AWLRTRGYVDAPVPAEAAALFRRRQDAATPVCIGNTGSQRPERKMPDKGSAKKSKGTVLKSADKGGKPAGAARQ
ncbi:hypothetical protein V502_06558, partial [Pseudogymnoascus sp. VKM F-4520 (FW-2644)]